jgi:hypothetical protein
LQTGGTGTTADPVLLPSVDGAPNYSDSSKNIGSRPEPNAIYNAYIFSAYKNNEYRLRYGAKDNLAASLNRIYYAKITGQLEIRDTTPQEEDELKKSIGRGMFGLAIYGGGSKLSGPQALAAAGIMITQTLPAHLAEKGVEFAVEGLTQNAFAKFTGFLFNASKGIYRIVNGKIHKIIRRGGVEIAETISEAELNYLKKCAKEFSETVASNKHVPNPGGRLGNAVTRAKTSEVIGDLRSRGFTQVRTEVHFRPGIRGSGTERYADVIGRNPVTGETEIIQIGRTIKSDPMVPVIRERNALDDIIFSPDIRNYPKPQFASLT